ncbi:asparagine synthetase [Acetobacter oeni LMG 21952]|nr:asparagine synthetase [Acetobacter oeni LMG 21952]
MIANGEIYNDPDMRAEIGNDHYTTGSDCESALRLWQRDKTAFALRLRGMYAIAIYDSDQNSLVLARDPFGIKPLYISELPDGIAFASEPATLIAAGLVPPGIDPVKRSELLQLQFTTGSPTIFPGISRILPGETLHIKSGCITHRTRQSALPSGPVEQIDERAALTRLDAAIMDSVRVHERADVPFGLFLSGGIDSSTVLAAMSRLRREAGQGARLLTWTATFDTSNVANESEQAAHLAQSTGAIHEIVRIKREDFWRHLPAIAGCMDDPVADYAIVPTWLLARRARESATVVLSGEGGDELFAGYGRYRRALRPWWRGGRKMRRKGIFDGLDVLRPDHSAHWRNSLTTTERDLTHIPTRLSAFQAIDMAEWLPNDLLLKLDRCLMDHGLEGRTPLLDPAIANATWRLPDTLRIRDGKGKYLLRRWLERELPNADPFAPKKGFTVPVGEWIAQESSRLGPLMARQPFIAAIADPASVRTLFANASVRKAAPAAWTLLFYALWHRVHLEGMDRTKDVFEILSA